MKSFKEYITEESKTRKFIKNLGGTMLLGSALMQGAENFSNTQYGRGYLDFVKYHTTTNPNVKLNIFTKPFIKKSESGKLSIDLDSMTEEQVNHLLHLQNQAEEYNKSLREKK